MRISEYSGTNCLDVAEVIALEQKMVESGVPLIMLMERAGASLAKVAEDALRNASANSAEAEDITQDSAGNIVILAGTGNNGGDGWVAARILGMGGKRRITLITPRTADELTAEPAHAAALSCESAIESGRVNVEMLVAPTAEQVAAALADAHLVIDAMLGTGFEHDEVREPLSTWIDLANKARAERGITIVAADCPSGLNAQTGNAAAPAIEADITVTMLAAKTGLLVPEAAPYVGKLLLAPLV